MQPFTPGQRWLNHAEPQLGLGTVLHCAGRTVTLLFAATEETRTYAIQSAPLNRVLFSASEQIRDLAGCVLTVTSVEENNDLATYQCIDEDGARIVLPESDLNPLMQLNRPMARLLNGQIDADNRFEIRYQTLLQHNRISHCDLHGFIGCRTSLIPHQLYIAHEVANRYAPRVLLADEVGLGKTIEAGLIIHGQLLAERAKRILIVTPENLTHQWLVEMLRRFNLLFRIFDAPRCAAVEDSAEQDNPFHTEQLVLCNLAFLCNNAMRLQQAKEGEWDLLVVDEAHHLQWSPEHVSHEYHVVEQLAAHIKGVLLLTATPEQLGKSGHFARLRLLDPNRFADYAAFTQEETRYEPIAHAVETLLSGRAPDQKTRDVLAESQQEGDTQQLITDLHAHADAQNDPVRLTLVEHLLDRHGTGRILFRNTRSAVQGFPGRKIHHYPLDMPARYTAVLHAARTADAVSLQQLLTPEILYTEENPHWSTFDPRVAWLCAQLKTLSPAKILVIAAHRTTVIALAQALRAQSGIHAALFHEGLTLLERDRAAAYFAQDEGGCQVLLCSEIGSEGRNFQFAHHLILFDLPLNPDVLEQRIGRLDRIGQTHTINIHAPYLLGSPQAILFQWYHTGLNAFEHTCPAGLAVYQQVETALTHTLRAANPDLATLLGTTQNLHAKLNTALQQGRDRLLEYNSCRTHVADKLQQRALAQEQNTDISTYMEAVFDVFGVHYELLNDTCFSVKPSEHLLEGFSDLPEDGTTITYQRATALANEDIQFLTWEHPMVRNAMETILSHELGNTAVTSIEYRNVTPGALLVECLYVLEAVADTALQASRYLPPTTIRIVLDEQGVDHSTRLPHAQIRRMRTVVDHNIAQQVVQLKQADIEALVKRSEQQAHSQAPDILARAHQHAKNALQSEIDRLNALRLVNPNVRQAEIDFFQQQQDALTHILAATIPRLDALRVMVAT